MVLMLGGRAGRVLIGMGTLVLALVALALTWFAGGSTNRSDPLGIVVALGLVAAIVVAYRFPIYIRHDTKICVFTVPIYLLTVFLLPASAAAAAGLGILGGELLVRVRHSNDPLDIATHVGRWIILVLLASAVAHVSLPAGPLAVQHGLLFTLAAGLLFAGDILTIPLVLAPITGERIGRIVLTCVRNGGPVEAAQYAVGVVGALIVSWHVWALVLLVTPTVLLYLLNKKEIDLETFQLLESMADAVDLRDPYTVEHSRRVVEVTASILRDLGRNGQEAELILAGARIHDIGKAVIPDQILLKHGSLNDDERDSMELHVERGASLVKRYPDFGRTVDMVRHHHERWDGTGYPDKLRGTEIPFGARIIAVADAFVAMRSDRAYRQALPLSRIVEILCDGRGRQWDPEVVDALLHSVATHRDALPELQQIDEIERREAVPSPATA